MAAIGAHIVRLSLYPFILNNRRTSMDGTGPVQKHVNNYSTLKILKLLLNEWRDVVQLY